MIAVAFGIAKSFSLNNALRSGLIVLDFGFLVVTSEIATFKI